MDKEIFRQYAEEKGISLQDARQTFMQVIVLKNIALPEARFMGGTALVLGHGNPRFSEDIDLTQVGHPSLLKPGLTKAAAELKRWLNAEVTLKAPKTDGRTWKLACSFSPSETLSLHVDCQEHPAYTRHPIVLQFPSVPGFIFEAESLGEIMADKVIAVARRNYLSGRDLFDLWFHWLRADDWAERKALIADLIGKKLKDRKIAKNDLASLLTKRFSKESPLERARDEWERYLPARFQNESVEKDILKSCRKLTEIFS